MMCFALCDPLCWLPVHHPYPFNPDGLLHGAAGDGPPFLLRLQALGQAMKEHLAGHQRTLGWL